MKKIVAIIELSINDDTNNVTDWLLEEVNNNLEPGEKVTDYHVIYASEKSDNILNQFRD
jgi:hypothetical protein